MTAPRIDQAIARPFLETITSLEGNAERLANRAGFGLEILERPTDKMDERRLFELCSLAARELDRPDYGFVAGIEPELTSLGSLGRTVTRSLTLWDALSTWFRKLNQVSSHSRWWLEQRPDAAWLCRRRFDGVERGQIQGELYVVGLMTRLVRQAAGAAWRPQRIDLLAPHCLVPEIAADPSRIRRSCPRTAIALEPELLAKPLHAPRLPRSLERLRAWIAGQLADGAPRIEEAAAQLGQSPRTLQRALDAEGLSYRKLVEHTKFAECLEAFGRDGITPLGHLAEQLGYADHAHFTRAFVRWTGVTPSRFRGA